MTKIEKFTAGKKIFFYQTLKFTHPYPYASIKVVQAIGEACSPQNTQHKYEIT
jgi:hypothetical protein